MRIYFLIFPTVSAPVCVLSQNGTHQDAKRRSVWVLLQVLFC